MFSPRSRYHTTMAQSADFIKEKMLFAMKFAAAPRTVGSVTPSSPYLVSSMFLNVDWQSVGVVAELGAGTGVMTKEILKRKSPGSRFFAFEIERGLRLRLSRDLKIKVYDDAAKLPQVLDRARAGKADLIVSGLPFAVLPRCVTAAVMDAVRRTLSDEGIFVAFQYSHHMKSSFEGIFEQLSTRLVVMNIPPAVVYECRGVKRGAGRCD
ncbi:class I SAM-dependent methyltransferase [Synergistes jonesii]|uniref:class I SAM-dependent methyltransferase n=1 Tax=Synergistes jonesii TaxID=2754 RepID=UPI00242F27A1|nr:methyltransferase type 11 [Synergistes jonesii]MDY2984501.1 methyltransferase type 11 [Synergistes jonesii]